MSKVLKKRYISEEERMEVEKFVEMDTLFSFYEGLLTEKQKLVMEYYYRDDYSLSEISDLMNISRQAVHDSIQKTQSKLLKYESKLHLMQKSQQVQGLTEELEQLLQEEDVKKISLQIKQKIIEIIQRCKELSE